MLTAGLHDGIPADSYHQDPAAAPSLSASIAHTICTKSAAHAYAAHPRLGGGIEREDDSKFDVGTVSHALLLQGHEIAVVIDAADWRTNAAKEARDAARMAGLIPLLAGQWERVQEMTAAALEQLASFPASPPLLGDGKAEQTLIWDEDGIVCRARLDWLHTDLTAVDDVKTTLRSANPEGWTRSTLFNIGADIQAAMYRRGVKAVFGVEPEFRFIVIESQPPYMLSVVSPGADILVMAEKKLRWALAVWRRCLETDVWPGYPQQVCYAELPAWEESRWLEKELREGIAA